MTDNPRISHEKESLEILLSPFQRREWMLWKMTSGNNGHVVAAARKLPETMDERIVQKKMETVFRHHPSLKGVFGHDAPTAVPASPDATIPLKIRNAGPNEDLNAAVARMTIEGAAPPFSLSSEPALRAILVRSGWGRTPEMALVLMAHPIVVDQRSLERLLEKVDSDPIHQSTQDECIAESDRPCPSDDNEGLESSFCFYENFLNGASFQTDLPTDMKRPPIFNANGAWVAIQVPESVKKAMKRFPAVPGSSLVIMVLSALAGYLGRVTRQRDICIGLATDTRSPGHETSVGPFENNAILRVVLEDDLTGRRLAERTHENLEALAPHRQFPFEMLLDKLQPKHDPSRTPLFQVRFNHRLISDDPSAIPSPTDFVTCDLEIVLEERGERVSLCLGYRTDLFTRDTIERTGGHIFEFLKGMCDRPDEALRLLPICTSKERDWILSTFGIQNRFPDAATVHELVSLAAMAHPDAIAVCSGETRLSYGSLNGRANQLAHRLRRSGVGRNVPVAVCMERSEALIIALLAILKAGGAYVPIETSTPQTRIEFILRDAQVRLVLTDPVMREKVEGIDLSVWVLDPGKNAFHDEPTTDPEPISGPTDLAYIIYTSGSTGQPKGVMIEHRHVVRLFRATQDWSGLGAEDVWAMFHSVAFDPSVWEIWGALIHGGRLVVVSQALTRSPMDFLDLLIREKVTVLAQTPSVFRQLIQAESETAGNELALRQVILGGETLDVEILKPWFERHGDQLPHIVNTYGPTETCVLVTYHRIYMKDTEAPAGDSVIGVPIRDSSTYVVDEAMQLLPPGVPGELVVGGAGLARGYLNRPEFTTDRFVANPFSEEPGDRLYRTGDMARFLPTGELSFLGRIDFQVKIRGFRIEPGEIESVLKKIQSVEDAAVIPWKRSPDETLLVAYVVSDGSMEALRATAREQLPEYMVPSYFIRVPNIPITVNGKLDRNALPDPRDEEHRRTTEEVIPPTNAMERIVSDVWREVLGTGQISIHDSFFDIGGTSVGVLQVAAKLKKHLGRDIQVAMLFQYPTVVSLARYLAGSAATILQHMPLPVAVPGSNDEPIAVIGMAGRFPGAQDINSLWEVLEKGIETITFFSDTDLDPSLDLALLADPAYVKARGIVEGADLFDADFFAMTRREAEVTDPQQRLLLELAWHALETAGHDPAAFQGAIGVYAGVNNNTYYIENIVKRPFVSAHVDPFQAMVGNEKDYTATRIAHRLDLKGPALSLHTACSTSLVAVVEAFHALRARRCDLALAGAASITCPQRSGYRYQEGGMFSPDGHTRPFDAQGKGTVFSDGAAMVALRRLSDALASGDTIYAVIRGAATNNDGGQRMSFSAPTVHGQADVITQAMTIANVRPETIRYVETHGTATPLGDPIEIEALKRAFGSSPTSKTPFCAIGSIKSNLGHLTAAAGATSLIKTVLALYKERIPASLGFSKPNPELRLSESPFYVASESIPWPKQPGPPRRAGVSSFGVGGTNAHVIVEEAPESPSSGPSRPLQLLVLSAKNPGSLEAMTANVASHLDTHPDLPLADVAFTLQHGRKPFGHRRALVAENLAEATTRLRASDSRVLFTGQAAQNPPAIVFLFPGQGAQYLHMGRDLYQDEKVFRDTVDQCAQILVPHLNIDIRSVLYPIKQPPNDEDTRRINDTWLAQPTLFVVAYALSRLWIHWGVKPAALVGHSIGEYMAAVLADALTLEEALSLVSIRARLMQARPPGSMLSIRLNAAEVKKRLPEGVSMAAINSPVLCVVSGPTEIVRQFQADLEAGEVATRLLHTSHAFHSAMMDPMLPEFTEAAKKIPGRPPKIPWISTLTGTWMQPEDLTDGRYWVRQIRQPVLFSDALKTVLERPGQILLEVGPGQALTQLARQHPDHPTAVPSLGPAAAPEQDLASIMTALAKLWVTGATIDWRAFSGMERRKRIPLPGYPFARRRHWLDPLPNENKPSDRKTAPVRMEIRERAGTSIKEPEMTQTASSPTADPSRKDRLITELRNLLKQYAGEDHDQTDGNTSFIDLGFDSLFLTQVSQGVQKRFGVKVTFRQMIETLCTLETLAEYLDRQMPADPPRPQPTLPNPKTAVRPVSPEPTAPGAPVFIPEPVPFVPTAGGSLLETVIHKQIAVMTRQLDMLRQAGGSTSRPCQTPPSAPQPDTTTPSPVIVAVHMDQKSHFGPFKPIEKGAAGGLTARQQAGLDQLIQRYNRRTAKSKEMTQKHRAHFCDPRTAGNFRTLWKEMVYPILCTRSKGSRIWDIDGNEYIDVTMGFGVNYLGHSPDFVMEALETQMRQGVEIGPQSPLAGEVAQMICEMTGMERATFCNTGSEAVMAAFRVARTVTGREKIVYFQGDYHGIFDEVLGRPALCDGVPGAIPIAPGIPHLPHIMILEYGNPASLDTIRKYAKDIAGVIVEPVQSRHPELQPRDFLRELRTLTREKDIALIFDEVITGFRVRQGGAQEYFGVKADLATYGKVVGGGMPIGVLAGSATYLDALDGGFWQYGDDSSPPTGVTFFAGTFVRHPLAMAAAHAVMKFLKTEGPALQERANRVNKRFVDQMNEFFQNRQLPLRLQIFSAFFFYDFHPDVKFASLLFYYLRDRGIHIWEGRVGSSSVAHTDADMDQVIAAFKDSIEEMQTTGFLPE